jgi:hypothetical protein
MRHAALVLSILLASTTVGCAKHVHLVGFPEHEEEDDLLEVARLLDRDVAAIEAAIDARYQARGREAWREHTAMRKLFATHLSLSNEHTDYFDPAQEVELRRPPIQRYPRLTCPVVAEPVPHPDGSGSTWFVPIVFTTEALYWSDSPETRWFGQEPERASPERERKLFARWLIPFGDYAIEEVHPQLVDDGDVIRPETLEVPLTDDVTYRLPNPRDTSNAVVLTIPAGAEIEPGYYAIRLLPRLEVPRLATPVLESVAEAFREGDWWAAAAVLVAFERSGPGLASRRERLDLATLAEAVEAFESTWYDDELDVVIEAFEELADPWRTDRSLTGLIAGMRGLLETNPHPAPIYLDEPGRADDPFTFVVTGDFQYSGDMTSVRRFLRMMSPGHARRDASLPDVPVDPELRARLDDAAFIVIAGDLADGEGLSSSPDRAVLHGLGVLPPASPYESEFPDLRAELQLFDKPLFGIPGNHDAFASFGGVLNDAAMIAADVLEDWVPNPLGDATHPIGEGFYWLAQNIPLLVKIGRMFEDPFFDGLIEYQHHLGPLNFAFRYRGHGFVGLNSANLTVNERDQVGPLAENWGGSLYPVDVLWFDVVCRRLARAASQEGTAAGQFVFLHHDPRAIVPFRTEEGIEERFVGYDHSDALLNMLTFGYLGIEHSPNTPIFIPIISPIGSYLPRYIAHGEEFDMEWMGDGTPFDTNEGRAEEILDAINENLAGGPHGANGIDHLFFAHNDIPYVTDWITDESEGYVFAPPDGGEWSGGKWGAKAAFAPFVKLRSVRPAEWGQDMRFTDGRNAKVVRVDDVGQAGQIHGFHLITVDPRAEGDDRVTIEWFEIPPAPEPAR